MLTRTSNTFYKVSKIISIILIPTFVLTILIYSICFGVIDATNTSSSAEKAELWAGFVAVVTILGIDLVFVVLNLVFTIVARKSPTKAHHILALVFGIISGVEFSAVAAILGLVALKNNQVENPEVVEAKVE